MLHRLRGAFSAPGETPAPKPDVVDLGSDVVEFIAFAEDCIISAWTVLDADRLTDMLNDHEAYALVDVTVDRLDGGASLRLDDLVVARDELFIVHATGPRGRAEKRHRTSPQYMAVKMGPYRVRGFFHGLPGSDPVTAIRRRKAMVPLTGARIEYVRAGEPYDITIDTIIINREQADWVEPVEVGSREFPTGPKRAVTPPA